MSVFRIHYDLTKPGRDYSHLARELQAVGARRVLLSEWFLHSDASTEQVWMHFAPYVDASDRLVVDEVTRDLMWSPGRLLVSDIEMNRLLGHASRRAA